MSLYQPGLPSYTHTQSSANDVWTIDHNLNSSSLVCEVLLDIDGSYEVVIPSDITYSSVNQILINWSTPYSGIARIL